MPDKRWRALRSRQAFTKDEKQKRRQRNPPTTRSCHEYTQTHVSSGGHSPTRKPVNPNLRGVTMS